ncbi:hypothetical protein [Lysinibacillus xylanilyticus]|uniref:hypothetical protein n=1 Tax=Lysinibacillus xylanilyticus TaxID=582475 RepID=UPI000AB2B12F|nr:hypothetical protein [Lysinibacillus xylanilyticus]
MAFLCESEAAATWLFCAKAKRQQHGFSVRKRSGSNNKYLYLRNIGEGSNSKLQAHH